MKSQNLVLAAKLLVTLTWLAAAAAFLLPGSSTFGQLGRLLFYVLLGVHAVECAVFFPTLKRTGRPLGRELAGTLLFGVIHFAEAKAVAAEAMAVAAETEAHADAGSRSSGGNPARHE